jgi:putative spermidine/putrescine transport system permease protein
MSATRRSPVLATLTAVVTVFMVAPMVLSVLAGVVENNSVGLKSGLTLRWFAQVWEVYGGTVWASLGIAFACVLCTLLIGVPLAYTLAVSRSRVSRALEEAITLPVAVPGLATALALILAYGTWREFRSSYAFILCGHVVFTLPFMTRTVSAAFARPELRSLEEAARTLGASFARRMMTVLVPAVLPDIAAACLMVFTLSVGEFNLTWMLHTPLTRTLPVGLADSYASMRLEVGSAYTLVFFAVILPPLWALQWIARHFQQRHEGA